MSIPVEAIPKLTRGCYAFAVVGCGSLHESIEGIDGAPVHISPYREIGIAWSDVDPAIFLGIHEDHSESGRLARLARRHDEVMQTLMRHTPVLPLRFGTVVREVAALPDLLASAYDELAERLQAVGRHFEWQFRVTVAHRELSTDRAPVDDLPVGASARGGSGTDYLLRRRTELDQRRSRRRVLGDTIGKADAALTGFASEALSKGRPGHVLGRAYLVPEIRRELFLAAAERAAADLEALGCRTDLVGPWPPYSFARVALGAPADD